MAPVVHPSDDVAVGTTLTGQAPGQPTGTTVELLERIGLSLAGSWERVVAQGRVQAGGYWEIHVPPQTRPTLSLTGQQGTDLKLAFAVRIAGEERPVQVMARPAFMPVELNLTPGGNFTLLADGCALSFGMVVFGPIVVILALLPLQAVTPETPVALALLLRSVPWVLLGAPLLLLLRALSRQHPFWAQLRLTVGPDGVGSVQIDAREPGQVQSVQLWLQLRVDRFRSDASPAVLELPAQELGQPAAMQPGDRWVGGFQLPLETPPMATGLTVSLHLSLNGQRLQPIWLRRES